MGLNHKNFQMHQKGLSIDTALILGGKFDLQLSSRNLSVYAENSQLSRITEFRIYLPNLVNFFNLFLFTVVEVGSISSMIQNCKNSLNIHFHIIFCPFSLSLSRFSKWMTDISFARMYFFFDSLRKVCEADRFLVQCYLVVMVQGVVLGVMGLCSRYCDKMHDIQELRRFEAGADPA